LPAKKSTSTALTNDQIREIILRYLFRRNQNATSRRGKSTGSAVTISVMRADLKASDGLTVQQIHSNLTYLESQDWVKDQPVTKSFTTGTGAVIPSETSYFIIMAAGIDRIGGPSVFTRDRFEGIKFEATGQNIITLGDGNQVNAQFQALGESLADFRKPIEGSSTLTEPEKVDLVVDVDTLQTQLGRKTPNRELHHGEVWGDRDRLLRTSQFLFADHRPRIDKTPNKTYPSVLGSGTALNRHVPPPKATFVPLCVAKKISSAAAVLLNT